MYENNENGANEREQHLTRISTLEADLASVTAERNQYQYQMQVSQSTISKACAWFEDTLAGDIDAATPVEEFGDLMEILGVEATREVSIAVQVTWHGTIQLPYGTEADDLDIDEFDIDFNGHNEYDTNFTYDAIYDSEIRERSNY